MNQQPDKFFREKLEGYQKPVSASAWDRLENKLDKKKPKTLWLKFAAAVLLLVSVSIWWITREGEFTPTITRKEITPPTIKNQESPDKAFEQPDITDSKNERVAELQTKQKTTEKKSISSSSVTQKKLPVPVVTSDDRSERKPVEVPLQDAAVIPDLAVVEEKLVQEKPEVEKEENNITLVYTAEEVDNKYLNKKTLAEATREDKKSSTLKKLLEKAYDLKHNQDAFGELRQKKNEMLALNFKNEKERSQNR